MGGLQVRGSLSERADSLKIGVEEAFLHCDVVVMLDVSSSMRSIVGHGQSRWSKAVDELTKIQEAYPGRVALLSFNTYVRFHPGGAPEAPSGMTDMTSCLELARMADVPGMSYILISDGEPNSPSRALAEAHKFERPIHCVFIGNEGDPGHEFLRMLAEATGGKSTTTVRITQDLLDFTQRLLSAKDMGE